MLYLGLVIPERIEESFLLVKGFHTAQVLTNIKGSKPKCTGPGATGAGEQTVKARIC